MVGGWHSGSNYIDEAVYMVLTEELHKILFRH